MSRTMASLTLDTSVGNKPQSLHRYLDNLGPMSSLPTPTMDRPAQSFSIQAVNVVDSIYDDRKTLRGIAKKFSQTCTRASQGERLLAADVMEYLEAAHLPLESLTLTYNILVELSKPTSTLIRNDSCNAGEYLIDEERMSCRSELLLLASLQLAASFHDSRTSSWTDLNVDAIPQDLDVEELWRASADLFERVSKRLPSLASQEAHITTLKTLEVGYDALASPFEGGFLRKRSIRKAAGYFDGY